MVETRVILLNCKHSLIFREPFPAKGERVVCAKCSFREVTVIDAPAEIRIRCQDCGHSRPFGTARINGEIAAANHRKNHPGHVVEICDGKEVVRVFGTRDLTVIPMLPGCDQKPAF